MASSSQKTVSHAKRKEKSSPGDPQADKDRPEAPSSYPAFSPFAPEQVEEFRRSLPSRITRQWAFGDSGGKGVRVAILDSGIDAGHPEVGPIQGYADVVEEYVPDGYFSDGAERFKPTIRIECGEHTDRFGHGTACAGIVRRLAPLCEIVSVRVLGSALFGSERALLQGLEWAIDADCQICNLSLGTSNADYFGALHQLADRAHAKGVLLVVAPNNRPVLTFPATFAGVLSVGSHDREEDVLFYNRTPPAEFGARGIRVRVPWLEKGTVITTGNSYAAPHVTGFAARILGRHPWLNPAEVKTVLKAIADNTISRRERNLDGR